MAPEMIKEQSYGLPVDIWALGIVMHRLLTMKAPFQGNRRKVVKANIVNASLNLDSNQKLKIVTTEARALLEGMLTKDPAARLTIY